MVVSFYINQLNHHQAPVADELFLILGNSFHLIETCKSNEESKKGSLEDFSDRVYLLQAWKDVESHSVAMRLAQESDVAVFGAGSFDYQIFRLRSSDKVSFELSERWLKRGVLSLLSPRLIKNQWFYHTLFYRKPLYKLCASGFAASDQYKLHSFRGRCYKWGYFPRIDSPDSLEGKSSSQEIRIMWCSRFLKLKHPELPVLLAKRLRNRGYHFIIDMYGSGEEYGRINRMIKRMGLNENVKLHGSKPNDIILTEMQRHSVFLFTSDRHEGWGAVANESMANGCLLVSSCDIGSTPYLIKHRITGCVFKSKSIVSLENEVVWIIEHPTDAERIRERGMRYVQDVWGPKNAAYSLIKLSDSLINGQVCPIVEGPCSFA